jgi:hypothetical protein
MTEEDWLACTDPKRMLDYLRRKASDRKLRLFACDGCRRLWWLLRDKRSRTAVEVSEHYADGLVGPAELAAAAGDARRAADEAERARSRGWYAAWTAAMTAEEARAAAEWVAANAAFDAELLRDIFGNPFRPASLDPAWLTWSTGTVPKIAQAAYDERELPSGHLDTARLAILADALEEAGCDLPDLLGHLRGPGPHVRGCWAVDLLLGKE